MKLRNKKTGEIVDFAKGNYISSKDYGFVVYKDGGRGIEYNSLAELNEEWEDCEESKDFYYIQADGFIHWVQCNVSDYELKKFQAIGNYFETKEEAEKAVEKLKAWERLKDKGFRFVKWDYSGGMHIEFEFTKQSWATETEPDLDLLFGCEE